MPTYENTNEDGGSKKDDEYDIEYYERTGGKQAEIIIQEIHDARREISNVSIKQHYTCKYGMIAFFCNFALIGIILVLLSLMFANAGSIRSDEEKPDSIKPPSTEASEGKCETMQILQYTADVVNVVLILTSLLSVVTGCPDGYFSTGSTHCYRVSEERMTWSAAEDVSIYHIQTFESH